MSTERDIAIARAVSDWIGMDRPRPRDAQLRTIIAGVDRKLGSGDGLVPLPGARDAGVFLFFLWFE